MEKKCSTEFLTIEQASDLLNLKVSKLRRDIFMKAIPYYKIGALVRFKREELLKWINEKMVNAILVNNF